MTCPRYEEVFDLNLLSVDRRLSFNNPPLQTGFPGRQLSSNMASQTHPRTN